MTAPPASCCDPSPIKRYIGDAWPFSYSYYTTAADGIKTPISLASFTMTGLLLRGPGAGTIVAQLATTTDGTTNLAGGVFKFIVPSSVTSNVPPDPQSPQFLPTRLAVVQTDAAGNATTLGVQPIAVRQR